MRPRAAEIKGRPLARPASPGYTQKITDPAQPPPAADPRLILRHTLRWGSGLLACLTLLDVGREAFTGGVWRPTPALVDVYGMSVAAYAGTREWEKWGDPGARESYGGHWFFWAWVALVVALWLAGVTHLVEVSWPAGLTAALKWVFGSFAVSKTSGRLRAAGRGALPPREGLSPDETFRRDTLRLGANLLGVVCWLDCALEAFTMGEWHFAPALYGAYAMALGAAVATRQYEKWTDPGDKDIHGGAAFVAAWLALVGAIVIKRQLGGHAPWPENLTFAVGTVLAVYFGSKASVALRDKTMGQGWGTRPQPLPQAPDPVQRQETGQGEPAKGAPAEQPKPKTEPAPEDKPRPAPKDGAQPKRPVDRSKINPQVIAACRSLVRFRKVDLAEALGATEPATRGYIGVLSRAGLIESDGDGWYRWIGD